MRYPAAILETDREPSAGTHCNHHSPEEDKRTRQSDRDSSDVNLTIKKYNLQPDEFNQLVAGWSGRQLGVFGDMSVQPTFMELLDVVNRARDAFMQMPPEIRAYWRNDPALMLDRWNKGLDAEVFEELGLLVRLPDPAIAEAAARAARVAEIAEGVRAGSEEGEDTSERHSRRRNRS